MRRFELKSRRLSHFLNVHFDQEIGDTFFDRQMHELRVKERHSLEPEQFLWRQNDFQWGLIIRCLLSYLPLFNLCERHVECSVVEFNFLQSSVQS